LNETIKSVTKSLDTYNFAFAFEKLLNFAWEDFCNCYLEISKKTKSPATQNITNYIFTQILIMLHPFAPFVTEKLYSRYSKQSIMLAK
jgi:valyl-tRNA synthetase